MSNLFDLSVLDTDTITATITVKYGASQQKSFKVTIATLSWEEWLECESAIPDPVVPKTKIVYDDNGENPRKVENRDDPDYLKKRDAALWRRNGLRVVKSLEKAGIVMDGSRDEKIARVMNNVAVFQGLWSLVNGSANSVYKEVEATSESFRAGANPATRDENLPSVEANPV